MHCLIFSVEQLWSQKAIGQIEAVVGPYKLYDTSFETLKESVWLTDEPPGDLRNGSCNMRPPKRAPANPSFFVLLIHSDATRPIVPEDNTDLMATLQNRRRLSATGVADAQ
ncbi:UNVERIFIED_CONTAM: hypothetical protein FKN15_034486 [Acipenser sinensis]